MDIINHLHTSKNGNGRLLIIPSGPSAEGSALFIPRACAELRQRSALADKLALRRMRRQEHAPRRPSPTSLHITVLTDGAAQKQKSKGNRLTHVLDCEPCAYTTSFYTFQRLVPTMERPEDSFTDASSGMPAIPYSHRSGPFCDLRQSDGFSGPPTP